MISDGVFPVILVISSSKSINSLPKLFASFLPIVDLPQPGIPVNAILSLLSLILEMILSVSFSVCVLESQISWAKSACSTSIGNPLEHFTLSLFAVFISKVFCGL